MRKKANLEKPRLRHRNLPLLLLQSRERVIAYFRPILNANCITEQQWRIVRVLIEVVALEPRQLGELCGISSPSMAGVLDRMEQVGLVQRHRVKHDQRRVHVSLTVHARRVAEQMAPPINAAYERIQARLGPELWDRVQQTLDELITALPRDDVDAGIRTPDNTIIDPRVQRMRRGQRTLLKSNRLKVILP